jgi:hypothetical protein
MREALDQRIPGVAYPDEPEMIAMRKTMKHPDLGRMNLAALAVVAVMVVGACDGGNAFTGDDSGTRPEVLNLSLPQVAFAGEKTTVRVDASAPAGVAQVVLSLRGAVNSDTTINVASATPRLSQVVTFQVPTAILDTLLLVQAAVIDKQGAVSGSREGTIVVFGPPTITSLSTPTIVRLGDLISVRVSAFASRNVAQIDLVATGAIQMDTSIIVSPARANVTQDIVMAIPNEAQDTLIKLSVGARDAVGQGGEALTRTIPIVIEPPLVEISTPTIAHAGLNLDVQVHAKGVRRIGQIRVELRGAHVADVNVPISPPQTDFIQNVSIPLPPTIVLNDLRVRAAVVDGSQVTAYSSENLVTIPLGQPGIISLETPLQAYGGKVVDIRIRAQGDRPISKVEIRYRGVVDSTKTYTITTAQTSVIQDSWVGLPAVTVDGTLTILATVTDVSGAVSEIVSTNVTVLPSPSPEPDFELAFAPVFHTAEPPWARRSAFRILGDRRIGDL